jgi:hypothetical protein
MNIGNDDNLHKNPQPLAHLHLHRRRV